jgi:hypothetical protein
MKQQFMICSDRSGLTCAWVEGLYGDHGGGLVAGPGCCTLYDSYGKALDAINLSIGHRRAFLEGDCGFADRRMMVDRNDFVIHQCDNQPMHMTCQRCLRVRSSSPEMPYTHSWDCYALQFR